MLRLLIPFLCAASSPAQFVVERLALRHFPMDDANSSKVSLADLDGDGDLDAVATVFTGTSPRHRFYRNDGSGVFSTTVVWPDVTTAFGRHLVADFDRDGDADVLVDTGVIVNSSGMFVLAPGTYTQTPIAFGDMDGDTDGDLLAAHVYGHGVYLWRNSGNTFTPAPTGSYPTNSVELTDAAARDFDGDGDLDLLLATKRYAAPFTYWHGRDRLWINDGLGNFTEQVLPGALDADTYAMVVADFDGDGHHDCVLSTLVGFQLVWQLRLNDGVGNLVLTSGIPANTPGSSTLHAIDLDGDGDQDLLGSGFWLENDGSAQFVLHQVAMPRNLGVLQASGDVDTDGDNDLVFAGIDVFDGMQRLLLNDGAGGLIDATRLPWSQAGGAAAFADLDGDGDLDVIGANRGPIGRNDGLGYFVESPFPWQSGNAIGVQTADVDGDGDRDVLYVSTSGAQAMQLCINNGNGAFTDVGASGLPTVFQFSVRDTAIIDAEGDGDPDFVIADGYGGVSLLRNGGNGTFATAPSAFPAIPGGAVDSNLAVGDLDNDGDADVLWLRALTTGSLVYFANEGLGTFTDVSAQRLQMPGGGWSLDLGDLDGDGDLDVFVAASASNSNPAASLYLENNGGILTHVPGRIPGVTYFGEVELGDVDQDGDLDALVSAYQGGLRLWENLGSGQFADRGLLLPEPSPGSSDRPWLVDLDDDGDPELAIGDGIFTNQRWGADARLLCRTGRILPLHFRSTVATAGSQVWPFFGLQAARLPLPPLGTLAVAPSAAILLPPAQLANGEVLATYQIPADPGLVGLVVTIQGLFTAAPSLRLSPAVRITVRS